MNFRSYESFSLDDIGALTIFVGPNAAGKTNIIEAIQLLTALSTFRKATSRELIRNSSDTGKIHASISDGNRLLDVSMLLGEGRRKYTLNNKARSVKDLKGTLPSITFTPDDLALAKGSSKPRRDEVDLLGSQLNSNYYQILRDFEKILRHKNKALKDNPRKDILEAINEMFVRVSSQLTSYRSLLFERLFPIIARYYSEISRNKEELALRYIPSWEDDSYIPEAISISVSDANASLFDALQTNLNDEIRRGQCIVGANRDKVVFELDSLDASSFASQGQQRSLVLALKLAEGELVEKMTGQLPVLLLDDVMSELDGTRRDALVNSLLQDKQTFITTANIDYFDDRLLSKASVIKIGADE